MNKEEELKIIGMHCATCVLTVSKSLKSVNGVKEAEVNLATGTAKVILSDNVRLKELVKAVRKAGYDVATQRFTLKVNVNPEEIPKIEKKMENIRGVIEVHSNASLGTLIVEYNPLSVTPQDILREAGIKGEIITSQKSEREVAYRDFRDLLTRLIIGAIFTTISIVFPSLAFIFSIPVQFYSGLRFHRGAYRALRNKTTNMDVLVSLSSNIMWFSSVFLPSHPFFMDSALLITFVLVGKTLEAYIKAKMSSNINIEPYKAKLKDGRIVNSNELKVGDIIVVKSGEKIPADGIIESGEGEVDESILTGEQKPVYKKKGDNVLAGGILVNGYLEIYVTRNWDRSYIMQVTQTIREAYNARVSIQNLVDRISEIFVPIIITISLITFIVWKFILGNTLISSLLFSVSVLAAACPCALGLATPMAILSRVNDALKRGIIIRDGNILEEIRKVDVIILDKTGTVTEGKYIIAEKKVFIKGAFELASIAESKSSHPIANAFPKINGEVEYYEEFPGRGIYAKVNGNDVIVGNKYFVINNCDWNVKEDEGDIFICINGKAGAIINLMDKLKSDAKDVVNYLKNMGIKVILATGDHSKNAEEIARELGIEVYKGLTPDDKVELVRKFRDEGHVVMFVGDGINDAMAIKEADIGVAISGGTDLAKNAGKVVVKSLNDIIDLIEESKLTIRKIKENLGWAFGYNAILIPIASGVFYPYIFLPPEYAALAMSFSSVIVSLWSIIPF
ncbi:MAG: cation-translocating P-type ATPase [Saccharolobus sp.]|jgi:Cu2+-exporting ATPase|uniref:heavy metal translocating P-type ATPase n=1 Tax=Saccharolobus sp. TaxID=2100761 RepID=UPI0028CF9E69|nr:cation-translocating P-type ATPase [Saccharolobus sp.]MDT7862374.1 cation-translocating P-type ATPase [Saccharolobus sp.]